MSLQSKTQHSLPLRKKGLHIYHQNVYSLPSKLDELRILLGDQRSKVGIYGMTETHLSSKVVDDFLHIPGYTFHRRDRTHNSKGGVGA